MGVKRDPEEAHVPPAADVFDGGKTLSKIIDKGFPYDDGDNSIEDQTPKWSKKKTETPINVGKLNGENVTKQALVALVKDTDAPITQGLLQLDEMKSDADGLFKLMDANVTRGNLKNLVTDKPSPITIISLKNLMLMVYSNLWMPMSPEETLRTSSLINHHQLPLVLPKLMMLLSHKESQFMSTQLSQETPWETLSST